MTTINIKICDVDEDTYFEAKSVLSSLSQAEKDNRTISDFIEVLKEVEQEAKEIYASRC